MDESLWIANSTNNDYKDFHASTPASDSSLLLGTNFWTIHNDTKTCSPNGTYTAWLTLTGCTTTEFTCGDGSCVAMEQRCDGRRQCEDGTDESDCKLVNPAVGYDKFLTPPPVDHREEEMVVNMTLNIIDIINIDQVKGLFYTMVSVQTKWFDSGLTYNNLKKESQRNQINIEAESIWSPFVVFMPVENAKKIEPMQDFSLWQVDATDVSDFEPGDNTNNNNVYKFSGDKNAQDLTTQNSIEWICNFDLFWYPFDTQMCNLQFYIKQNYAKLHPEKFIYSGPMKLIEFDIKNYSICPTMINGKQGAVASIVFGRPLISNILTVFIPTLILLVISHVANRFDQSYVDMVIGVNLTVLLVLASL